MKKFNIAKIILFCLLVLPAAFPAFAQDKLDSPGEPGTEGATLTDIMNRITTGVGVVGHSLYPQDAPGDTMVTLEEIFGAIPGGTTTVTAGDVREDKTFITRYGGEMIFSTGTVATQTLDSTTDTVKAGYYEATTLSAVDSDLAPDNIKSGVDIFGISGIFTGTVTYTTVSKTGSTISYKTGEDGYFQMGADWPDPRFTDNGDGTVTDNLTGLMWTKDANLPNDGPETDGSMNWNNAINYCNNMNADAGEYGYTDWRLPNRFELESLLDLGRRPALPSGHPFIDVYMMSSYWSSTSYAGLDGEWAWHVRFTVGSVGYGGKTGNYYVWPVRGGQ